MKGLALVISLVIASAASSWAAEFPEGRFTIKCQEGGQIFFNASDLTIQSFSNPGMLVVKNSRGYSFVILIGGGQCVLEEQVR